MKNDSLQKRLPGSEPDWTLLPRRFSGQLPVAVLSQPSAGGEPVGGVLERPGALEKLPGGVRRGPLATAVSHVDLETKARKALVCGFWTQQNCLFQQKWAGRRKRSWSPTALALGPKRRSR